MGRRPCCAKVGIERGAWTVLEDKILTNYIEIHGEGKWRDLPQRAGLKRCGKSCRLRWKNYLKSDIKRGNISVEEEELIIKLHNLIGNRWSLIARRLPGRTDNEIKNYWKTKLSKRIKGPQKTQDSTKQLHKLTEKESEGKFSMALIPENLQLAIRPKAVRVTKVIIPQQLGHNNQMIKKNEVPTWDHNSSSSYSTLLEVEDDTSFLMDIDIGELFISDVLRSETHQEIEERNENDNGGGGDYGDMNLASRFDFIVSSFEDFLNNSTEESMMENWRGW